MAEEKKNWGNAFGVVSLVLGIISMAIGSFEIIPLVGIVLAIVSGSLGVLAIGFGIPGMIGSISKAKAIIGISFGSAMVLWSLIRIFWLVSYNINTIASSLGHSSI